jgi:hypothetical protein
MQAPARRILAGEQDVFDLAVMLQAMQPLAERRIGRQSHDRFQPEHPAVHPIYPFPSPRRRGR